MIFRLTERDLQTKYGTFREILYYDGQKESIALVMGQVAAAENVICRVHSACVSGHVFSSVECECRMEMEAAQSAIEKAGKGVIIYLEQEGKGNGHLALMASIPYKKAGLKQAEAYERAGFEKDALASAKDFVNEISLPDDALFPPALEEFFRTVARPETKLRMSRLLAAGLQSRSDVEFDLGRHVALPPNEAPAG